MTVQALRGQTVVARTTTGGKGGYRLRLRPGSYLIRIVGAGAFRGGRKLASVSAGRWTHLDIAFDTGIR